MGTFVSKLDPTIAFSIFVLSPVNQELQVPLFNCLTCEWQTRVTN